MRTKLTRPMPKNHLPNHGISYYQNRLEDTLRFADLNQMEAIYINANQDPNRSKLNMFPVNFSPQKRA